MSSIYTKSQLKRVNRNSSFEYRLARNIACKYGEVYAVAWTSEDNEGNAKPVGVNVKTFAPYEEWELRSFIYHFVFELGLQVSFAKKYENLPVQSWI